MPERLSDIGPSVSVVIGNAGDRPLSHHPNLAMLAMEAVASWANVEGFMLRMFVQLMGGKNALAANVYLGLKGDGPKTAAISSAAETVLSEPLLDLFKSIQLVAKTNSATRLKFQATA